MAKTARMCASLAAAGRAGAYGCPVTPRPARVSQHHAGPAPSRPVAVSPALRQRATIPRSRSVRTPRKEASRSYGAPYMSPHNTSPATSRGPRRTVPASARRDGAVTVTAGPFILLPPRVIRRQARVAGVARLLAASAAGAYEASVRGACCTGLDVGLASLVRAPGNRRCAVGAQPSGGSGAVTRERLPSYADVCQQGAG